MKQPNEAVIVAYGRSPLARAFKGGFAQTHPAQYAGAVLKGVLARVPQLTPDAIDDVVVGCAVPEGYTGWNIARQIAQVAGLPASVPAQTVNRFCASGLQAIATAAHAIEAGQLDIVVAGGVERMTGMTMGHPEAFQDQALVADKSASYMSMGETAEQVARVYHISRVAMEAMAVESHAKAAAAQAAGKFRAEIIPVQVTNMVGELVTLTEDEGIRSETTAEKLATLMPCFLEDGLVTAGTASQMTDGASFVVLMSRDKAAQLGVTPIARWMAMAVAGVPAEIMGIGPVVAVPKALKKAGLNLEDMDVIELNEAFAAQALACIQALGLSKDKVNPNGGAMALGHPMGATGAVLTCKVISELTRTGGKNGLITLCVGGGMGVAGVLVMEAEGEHVSSPL